MNTTTLIGRLGNDPDIRHTTGGTPVTTFRLAVRNPRDDDHPNWIPIVAYGKTAQAAAEHLTRGDQAAITGTLTSSEWDDNDGVRHYRLEVTARTIDFLARKQPSTNPTGNDAASGAAGVGSDEEPF